ncbi:hypothetical protein FH972_022346 [Carpinus fangiana]|uniref:Uncharacterized protein n=1 Tax=Carpinus fangiana TaxID=176857 RepID=A0A5N6KS05_9ROSI|nr:hypothetical protein FH972_022346 [Carpinus fangiana]
MSHPKKEADITIGSSRAPEQRETFGLLAPWSEPAWYNALDSPYYNESHKKFRAYVRNYIDEHILPYAAEWEAAGEAPRDAALAYAQSGLAFADVPLAYRPANHRTIAGIPVENFDIFHMMIMTDEGARVQGGVMASLSGASVIGAPPIINFGTEAQKQQWLPKLFTWEVSFCLGITEPTGGSDVSNLRTTARKTPDGTHYIVNGHKKWITGAPWATHMTTAVRTGGPGMGGISLLVVPLDSPGVSRRKIHNSGQNAGGSSWVTLEDVRVPVENIVGRENYGFPIIMTNFNKERFIMSIGCNRHARVCLAEALQYSFDRETFGQPLAAHQIIRNKIVTLARYIESHWAWLEQIAYHIGRHGWQAKDIASRIALAKIQGGRIVELAARESQQVLGGRGYERGVTATEQISRDLRMSVVGGGSEEIIGDLAWREEHRAAMPMCSTFIHFDPVDSAVHQNAQRLLPTYTAFVTNELLLKLRDKLDAAARIIEELEAALHIVDADICVPAELCDAARGLVDGDNIARDDTFLGHGVDHLGSHVVNGFHVVGLDGELALLVGLEDSVVSASTPSPRMCECAATRLKPLRSLLSETVEIIGCATLAVRILLEMLQASPVRAARRRSVTRRAVDAALSPHPSPNFPKFGSNPFCLSLVCGLSWTVPSAQTILHCSQRSERMPTHSPPRGSRGRSSWETNYGNGASSYRPTRRSPSRGRDYESRHPSSSPRRKNSSLSRTRGRSQSKGPSRPPSPSSVPARVRHPNAKSQGAPQSVSAAMSLTTAIAPGSSTPAVIQANLTSLLDISNKIPDAARKWEATQRESTEADEDMSRLSSSTPSQVIVIKKAFQEESRKRFNEANTTYRELIRIQAELIALTAQSLKPQESIDEALERRISKCVEERFMAEKAKETALREREQESTRRLEARVAGIEHKVADLTKVAERVESQLTQSDKKVQEVVDKHIKPIREQLSNPSRKPSTTHSDGASLEVLQEKISQLVKTTSNLLSWRTQDTEALSKIVENDMDLQSIKKGIDSVKLELSDIRKSTKAGETTLASMAQEVNKHQDRIINQASRSETLETDILELQDTVAGLRTKLSDNAASQTQSVTVAPSDPPPTTADLDTLRRHVSHIGQMSLSAESFPSIFRAELDKFGLLGLKESAADSKSLEGVSTALERLKAQSEKFEQDFINFKSSLESQIATHFDRRGYSALQAQSHRHEGILQQRYSYIQGPVNASPSGQQILPSSPQIPQHAATCDRKFDSLAKKLASFEKIMLFLQERYDSVSTESLHESIVQTMTKQYPIDAWKKVTDHMQGHLANSSRTIHDKFLDMEKRLDDMKASVPTETTSQANVDIFNTALSNVTAELSSVKIMLETVQSTIKTEQATNSNPLDSRIETIQADIEVLREDSDNRLSRLEPRLLKELNFESRIHALETSKTGEVLSSMANGLSTCQSDVKQLLAQRDSVDAGLETRMADVESKIHDIPPQIKDVATRFENFSDKFQHKLHQNSESVNANILKISAGLPEGGFKALESRFVTLERLQGLESALHDAVAADSSNASWQDIHVDIRNGLFLRTDILWSHDVLLGIGSESIGRISSKSGQEWPLRLARNGSRRNVSKQNGTVPSAKNDASSSGRTEQPTLGKSASQKSTGPTKRKRPDVEEPSRPSTPIKSEGPKRPQGRSKKVKATHNASSSSTPAQGRREDSPEAPISPGQTHHAYLLIHTRHARYGRYFAGSSSMQQAIIDLRLNEHRRRASALTKHKVGHGKSRQKIVRREANVSATNRMPSPQEAGSALSVTIHHHNGSSCIFKSDIHSGHGHEDRVYFVSYDKNRRRQLLVVCLQSFPSSKRADSPSSVEIVGRHEQLEAQLRRDIHVRHVLALLELLLVVEVLADFFEHDAAVGRRLSVSFPAIRLGGYDVQPDRRDTHFIFSNVTRLFLCSAKPSRGDVLAVVGLGGDVCKSMRTGGVQHAADRGRTGGCAAEDVEFVAI